MKHLYVHKNVNDDIYMDLFVNLPRKKRYLGSTHYLVGKDKLQND